MTGTKKSAAVRIADRRAQVARLQRAGMSIREVAAELGVSVGTVQSDRMALIGKLYDVATEDMAAWKASMLASYRDRRDRLEQAMDPGYYSDLIDALTDRLADEQVPAKIGPLASALADAYVGKLAALSNAWCKVDEREGKLLGTDAPTRSEVLTGGLEFPTEERAAEILEDLPD